MSISHRQRLTFISWSDLDGCETAESGEGTSSLNSTWNAVTIKSISSWSPHSPSHDIAVRVISILCRRKASRERDMDLEGPTGRVHQIIFHFTRAGDGSRSVAFWPNSIEIRQCIAKLLPTVASDKMSEMRTSTQGSQVAAPTRSRATGPPIEPEANPLQSPS